jgi:hypothetical protein
MSFLRLRRLDRTCFAGAIAGPGWTEGLCFTRWGTESRGWKRSARIWQASWMGTAAVAVAWGRRIAKWLGPLGTRRQALNDPYGRPASFACLQEKRCGVG